MISISGVGPGNPKYLTLDVYERIKTAEKVLAFSRVKETLKEVREDIEVLDSITKIKNQLTEDTAILASGDALYYGIADYLMRTGVKVDLIQPGISSFQYLMAKLALPWQDYELVSLHGREIKLDELVDKKAIFLTDKEKNPNYLSKELHKLGAKGRLYVGSKLSYDDEKIEVYEIGQTIQTETELTVVVKV